MLRQKFAAAMLLSAFIAPTFAQQTGVQPAKKIESDAVTKFKDEGMNRSQAMATMRYLTEVIGARLTNSPAQKRANVWTKEQLTKWGMQNAAVDSWGEFGRGWELKRFTASVVAPEYIAVRAYPKAWSPSTSGAVTGDVVIVDATDEAGLEKYKGKLKGAIVLTSQPREIKPGFTPTAFRRDDAELKKLEDAVEQPAPAAPVQNQPTQAQRDAFLFNARKFRFYQEEGAAVLIEPSGGVDSGTIRVMGASVPQTANADGNPFGGVRVYDKSAPVIVPQLVAETEQYNRLYRMVTGGAAMKMTVDLDVKFQTEDLNGYNTIAEIPGTDLKDEVVMIGAHLDSWHSAGGATDNGAGVTVVMEAMRILQASGFKPRRTIRVGLWTGEEQGLLGSRGYVNKYLAALGDASPRTQGEAPKPRPVTKKAGYDKFAAYYNLDNGTGKIRGVYMQGNEALRPIFREYLAPFKEMGASTLTVNGTGGTDHQAFDSVGLPGFQFIQDPIEYFARTWHTTQDVYDRIIEDDLKQSSIIMATFAYNSATSDEKLPRKTNPNLSVAAFLNGVDLQALIDERRFAESNLNFSICGHELDAEEMQETHFPSVLT
ncbi:MAG: M20/M25/M40 family metallo-hydrolase, partial [Pyrinomonadaceae bacterium]|nr:M20/M25/M40 family metallo-hydrolase [Pyrinomonadaceae bacterium]